jgi:hypothetical protein
VESHTFIRESSGVIWPSVLALVLRHVDNGALGLLHFE